MKKALDFALVAALLAGVSMPTLAGAQSNEVTEISFEDDLISGDLVRPDGENIQVTKRGGRSSLIRIRQNFIPEMLKSVEDL
ncbi:MAG: hypothetical protein GXY23_11015 [Myxococcales bacterium]|jgi:hypothetical protein|nr:hypothetical protein [Myxococcales bacterium]